MMEPIDRRTVLRTAGTGTALLLGSAGLASGDDHDSGDGGAGLRVAHAAPDAPAVDVLVDGAVAVPDLAFREVTGYLELPAGEYDVAVNVAGTDTTVFGPVTVALDDEDYTAVAWGEVTSDDTDFAVSLFEDTNGANLGDDEARVRAIHASPDAPAVDVTVNDGALTVFDDVAFGESSGYAVVPAGTYEVEIRPGGGGDPVYEVGGVTLEGGSTYTAFALSYLTPGDEPADEAFGLTLTLDAGAPPRGDGDDGEVEDEGEDEDDYEEEGEDGDDYEDESEGEDEDGDDYEEEGEGEDEDGDDYEDEARGDEGEDGDDYGDEDRGDEGEDGDDYGDEDPGDEGEDGDDYGDEDRGDD